MILNERRFVLDTNVLISAFLFHQNKPRQALDKAQEAGIILLSNSVFEELLEVLLRPKFDRYLSLATRENLLEDLTKTALFISPREKIEDCRDPKDNKYLELAVCGEAEFMITGDEDLLVLNPFRGIEILTVQEFLEKK